MIEAAAKAASKYVDVIAVFNCSQTEAESWPGVTSCHKS